MKNTSSNQRSHRTEKDGELQPSAKVSRSHVDDLHESTLNIGRTTTQCTFIHFDDLVASMENRIIVFFRTDASSHYIVRLVWL